MDYGFKVVSRSQLSKYYSTAGVILLFFGIFYLDTNKVYPSVYALIPCFATFLLIKGGFDYAFQEQTGVSKFLSFGILPKIGKISYSIYLVHFPIILFLTLYIDSPILLVFTSLILTYLFSTLLFNFVEKKFRYEKLNNFFYKYIVLFLFAFPLLLIINFDFMHINTKGKNLFQELKIEKLNRKSFDYRDANKLEKNITKKDDNYKELDTILIIGDSHADNIFMMFSENSYKFKDYTVKKFHLDTICLNSNHRQKITGYLLYGFNNKGTCQVQIENLIASIEKNNIKYYILSNHYNLETILYFKPYVDKYFTEKNVIIIPQVIGFENFNKNILLSTKLNLNKNINNNILDESLEIKKKMIIYAQNNQFNYFNINQSLCNNKNACTIYDVNINKFIFVDGFGHLSLPGIRKIKYDFFNFLNSLEK